MIQQSGNVTASKFESSTPFYSAKQREEKVADAVPKQEGKLFRDKRKIHAAGNSMSSHKEFRSYTTTTVVNLGGGGSLKRHRCNYEPRIIICKYKKDMEKTSKLRKLREVPKEQTAGNL